MNIYLINVVSDHDNAFKINFLSIRIFERGEVRAVFPNNGSHGRILFYINQLPE